jgi:hypothetical protein
MTIKDFYIQVEYILIHRIFSSSNELRSYYRVLANKIDNEEHRKDILNRIDTGEFDKMYDN